MADALTMGAALMVLIGFSFLFWFIRRLGILELEAAMMQDHLQRPKADPQPMVEVKNPFEMTVSSSSTLGCVEVIVNCLHPCHITCCWRVKKEYLNKMVYQSNAGDENEDADQSNIKNLQSMLEENCEKTISTEFTDICSGKKLSYKVEDLIKDPSAQTDDTDVIQLYDMVVAMELTEEHRQRIESPSSITAMLIGIELKRQNENVKPCLIQQFIQTSNGNVFKLKKLFLEEPTNHDQSPTNHDQSPTNHDQSPSNHARSSSAEVQGDNLCIVCQMLPISRALIPCGHACLCSLCFGKMNTCPMCRQPMTSSFILREEPNLNRNNDYEFSEILKRMNPLEIIRGIYNAS